MTEDCEFHLLILEIGGENETCHSLLLIQILAGNIILRHFMRANFPLVRILGVFHALHHIGLERVSFLEQLVHALRIRTFGRWTIPANLPIARPAALPVPPLRMPPYLRFGFYAGNVSFVQPPSSRQLTFSCQPSFSLPHSSELPGSSPTSPWELPSFLASFFLPAFFISATFKPAFLEVDCFSSWLSYAQSTTGWSFLRKCHVTR